MPNKDFATMTVGFLEVNCYLVPSVRDNCLYIIDPGAEPEKIIEKAKSFLLDDYRILLTHAHIDHIGAVGEMMERLPVSNLFIHKDDLQLYRSPKNALLPFLPALKDIPEPSKIVSTTPVTTDKFRIIHTPGHTRGGVCFYFEDFPALFSGDTIFCNSIGRTDLPGGDLPTLLSSIREKIFTFPDALQIFPGHGPSTTIKDEKKNNPWV